MKAEEMRAEYSAITCPQNCVERVSFGEVTVQKVDQGGPSEAVEFIYVDISSVDNKLKRITESKTLTVEAAPSRAKQRLKSGDVLVSMTRPNLNAVAIVPPELDGAVGSTGFHVLRATEGTEPRWLYYAVQTKDFISAMSELVQGALYPAVRPKDIRAYEIPHPPLDQQKRIVAEIEKQFSRLDEAVANLKRVKANLKRYKAAVLKAAVEGRLVETEAERARKRTPSPLAGEGGGEGGSYETGAQLLQRILETRRSQWKGKGKYKEPTAPDTTDLPELPEGWVWTTIGQVAECLDSKRIPVNKKERFNRPGDIPYYGANGRVGFIDDYLFDEPLVLVVEDETFTGRELPFCYKISGKSWVNNHAHVLRPTSMVTLDYLNYALSFYPFTPLTTGTTGRKKLTQLALVTAPLGVPPLQEQERIVAEIDRSLSIADEAEVQVNANLQRAARLRQSILSVSFNPRNRSKSAQSNIGEPIRKLRRTP